MRAISPRDATVLAIAAENIKGLTPQNLNLLLSVSDNNKYIRKVIETMSLVASHRKISRQLKRYSRAASGLLKWAENNRTIHAPRKNPA